MRQQSSTPQWILKRVGILLLIGMILTGLLALDLANKGLVWEFAWSVTGEEDPVSQILGVTQWVTGQRRPSPNTASMTPIQHVNVNPYGINTFLEQEVDPAKREAQMQMIADAGFHWIRQQFIWEDIEVDGRGQFTDSRNDYTGDGEVDTIDAWIKYDHIVDLADQYGIEIQARLDNPPDWARENADVGDMAPPDDIQDFVNYAVAVAERYQGRIRYYQIWNEPNLFFEWGNQPVDPEAYTELLCRTHDALKAVDPDIVIITGAIAPTIELTGFSLMDTVFLQRMYDAGAGECFDILSAQGYGLWSGPTDQRLRPTLVNVARPQYIRDIMVNNGDAHKPIWISEAAWNPVPTYDEVPLNPDGSDPINARLVFGQVTTEQASEWIPQYYQRTQEDWSWLGVVNYWFFTRASDRESNQSYYYMRMVEPDYSDDHPTFTPLPIYHTMQDYIANQTPTLYAGIHQIAEHWAITPDDDAQIIDSTHTHFDTSLEASSITFTAHGTDMRLRWRGESITVEIDGELQTLIGGDSWQTDTLASHLTQNTHVITISADSPIQLDSLTVANNTWQNLFPIIAVGISLIAVIIVIFGIAFWTRYQHRNPEGHNS